MAKKTNANNKQKGKTKREKRRNVKQIPREHWKFKNSHINKKALAKKNAKLLLSQKNQKKEKEE
jgi:hypothetical protein